MRSRHSEPRPSGSFRTRSSRPYWLLVSVTTIALLGMTLTPGGNRDGLNLVPLKETLRVVRAVGGAPAPLEHPAFGYLLWNLGGNVAVFLPLGFGLAGLMRGLGRAAAFTRAVLAGLALSVAIEVVQLAIPNRATDVDDVLLNTVGAALGAGLFTWLLRRPRRGAAG